MATDAEIAARFSSLGGGAEHRDRWAFGCEFGFYQQSLGVETPGLMRWASMHLPGLLLALRDGFRTIDDPATIRMVKMPNRKWWEAEDLRYGFKIAHSGIEREKVPERTAAERLARVFGRLRDRLIEDLTTGQRLFVWRPLGYTPPMDEINALADEVTRYGGATLAYVLPDPERAGTASRHKRGLVVSYIDRFAPRYENGKMVRIDYNTAGWTRTCRAVIECIEGKQ